MAQDTSLGDREMKLSPKYLARPEGAEVGRTHMLELRETSAMVVGKLRVAGGDWFHRVQRESMGIGSRTPPIGNRD